MKNIQIFLIVLLLFASLASASDVRMVYAEYSDGTKSAAAVTCGVIGCCEQYLNGLQTGEWRFITKLNCINKEGVYKEYNNGEDADKPTTVINTPKVEFTGKCPTFIDGDKNSLVQDCRDTTISLTIGQIILTLGLTFGGFTLFGFGIAYYLFRFIPKRKKKQD